MNVHARLERFTKTTHRRDAIETPSEEQIEHLVRSIRDDWSTTIELWRGEDNMMISASEGRYSVLVGARGEFFDLVGEGDADGEVLFVHGGQPASHDVRHLVTPDLATAAASAFFRDDTAVPPKEFLWEKQE
jgi:hypothetical protein